MTGSQPDRRFLELLDASLAEGTFVRLLLTAPTPEAGELQRVQGRLVTLRGQPHLSLTFRYPTRDETRNVALDGASAVLEHHVRSAFASAWLETTHRDWQLQRRRDSSPRLIAHKARTTETPSRAHDEPKDRVLDATAQDWLEALEIMDSTGRVRPSKADKYRQIARYAELLHHLVRDLRRPQERPFALVDMGCGKGYLTFAAWHLLHRRLGQAAHIVGVERRPELVRRAEAVARQLPADGLAFACASIDQWPMKDVDVLVALHACDTATDDALLRGIRGGAQLLVVAPCCHQQVRPQLGNPLPLAPILAHGLMKERFAEWLTDGIRALFLEWAGYETRLVEFISPEHTAKNLLLAGILRRPSFADPAARERILALKRFFEVKHHALDALLATPPLT